MKQSGISKRGGGTRPDDRGPYFAPEAWEETRNIKAALESVFNQLAKTDQSKMLGILGLNRVPVFRT